MTKRSILLRKCVTIMLSLALVFAMMPMVPGAVEKAEAAETANTVLYITDKSGNVTALNEAELKSDAGDLAVDHWKWNAADKQLELSGFDGQRIESDGDLNIVLTGSNKVTMPASAGDTETVYGIRSTGGAITMQGDGAGGRDSLTVEQTAIQNMKAKYYAIAPKTHSTSVTVTDCNLAVNMSAATAADGYVYAARDAVAGDLYATGDANVDMNLAVAWISAVSRLYAQTSGTIDIAITDPDDSDAVEPKGAKCVSNLYATGSGAVNLRADGSEGEAIGSSLTVGAEAGTITGKGNLIIAHESMTYSNQFEIADEKAISNATGTEQYGIVYCAEEHDDYVLMREDGTYVKDWKIATVAGNPLTFIDHPVFDLDAAYLGTTLTKQKYFNGLVYGGKAPYTFTATGFPAGIGVHATGTSWIYGTYNGLSESGTATITVKDANGNTDSIEVAYGAVTEKPKYITVDGTKFETKENKTGAGWAYTASGAKLELNNYNGGSIVSEIDLNIVLTGSNKITMLASAANSEDVYGICSTGGAITIKGDGAGGRDSLTVEQTAIQNMKAYYYAIAPMNYSTSVTVTDCNLAVNMSAATAADGYVYAARDAVAGDLYATGDANVDMNLAVAWISAVSRLYAQTSGTIDIAITDPDDSDAVEPKGAKCVSNLYATGSGAVNLRADGSEGEAIGSSLTVGAEAGTITGKGNLIIAHESMTYSNQFEIADEKAISNATGTEQYGIVYCAEEHDDYVLMREDGTYVKDWKIATVAGNPLTFIDHPVFDLDAAYLGTTLTKQKYFNGLVYGGKAPYTFTATGFPAGIGVHATGTSWIYGTYNGLSESGTATITVKDANGNTDSIEVAYGAVMPKDPVTDVSLDKEEVSLNVNTITELVATVTPDNASIPDVTWASDDISVASVDKGTIIGRAPGMAIVTVTTVQGGFKDTCTVYVKERKPAASQDDTHITGLVADTKYTIDDTEYTADENGKIAIDSSWRKTTVSIVKVNAEPKCNSDAQELEIKAQPLQDGWIILEYDSVPYDGIAKEPGVSVKDGETTLVKDTDYTVSYANNTNAGTATVTVTGSGIYSGTVEKTFKINGIDIATATLTLSQDAYDYDGTQHKPSVIVTMDETLLEEGTDYEIVYDENINAGNGYVTVVGKGKYEGETHKAFVIKAISLEAKIVTLAYDKVTYDGTAKEPGVTIDGLTASDYTVSYSNNTNAGTATVTIEGKGNYKGTITKNFTIEKADVNDVTVTLDHDTFAYTGASQGPNITVKDGEKTLALDTDYIITGDTKGTAAGTYTFTIEGKGNYEGSIEKTFTINPCTHDWDEGIVTKDSTCSETGTKVWNCEVPGCGTTKSDTIPVDKDAHPAGSIKDIPAKAATCKEAGLTVGKQCTACGTVTVKQISVPKLTTHTYGSDHICDVCGDTNGPKQPDPGTPGTGGSSGSGTTPDPGTTPGTGDNTGGTTPGTTPGSGTTPGTGGGTGSGTTPGTGGSTGDSSGGSGTPDPGTPGTPGTGGSGGSGTPDPGTPGTPGTGGSGGSGTPDPGTPGTPGTGGSGIPDPGTPGTPDAHQHSYIKTVTKATAKKDGSIVEKCACGDVKSKTVIKKASKIKLSKSAYVYTGKVIKTKNLPKVIVKDSAGKTIAKSNYTIVKPKNVKKMKALGKYAYTIKFKGDKYKGSTKVYLEITPAKVTAKAPKAAKKAVTVTWKKGKKAQVTGYQVTVATNKKFTKNVKTKKIKGYSKTSYKMTKLKAKTKYYVKVRAYKVTKTGTVYGPWSAVKNAKTK